MKPTNRKSTNQQINPPFAGNQPSSRQTFNKIILQGLTYT